MRHAMGLNQHFPRHVLEGPRELRMLGVAGWWDRLMEDKVVMLMQMLRNSSWEGVEGVLKVWLDRLKEAAGCRLGLLLGEGEVATPYKACWLGQLVGWMREVKLEVDGEEELRGPRGGDWLLVECVSTPREVREVREAAVIGDVYWLSQLVEVMEDERLEVREGVVSKWKQAGAVMGQAQGEAVKKAMQALEGGLGLRERPGGRREVRYRAGRCWGGWRVETGGGAAGVHGVSARAGAETPLPPPSQRGGGAREEARCKPAAPQPISGEGDAAGAVKRGGAGAEPHAPDPPQGWAAGEAVGVGEVASAPPPPPPRGGGAETAKMGAGGAEGQQQQQQRQQQQQQQQQQQRWNDQGEEVHRRVDWEQWNTGMIIPYQRSRGVLPQPQAGRALLVCSDASVDVEGKNKLKGADGGAAPLGAMGMGSGTTKYTTNFSNHPLSEWNDEI